MSDLMSSGAAARQLGCSVSLLRKLESIGATPPARRLGGAGDRVYTATEVEYLRRLIATRRGGQVRGADVSPLTAA